MDFNKFINQGNNRTILQVIDGVVIGALSIASLYYAVIMIGTQTDANYFSNLSSNLIMFAIFTVLDCIIIAFTKPLFGFTSVIDNFKARAVVRKREADKKRQQEETAKATLAAAKAARKAARKK